MLKKPLLLFLIIPFFFIYKHLPSPDQSTGAPPYGEAESDTPQLTQLSWLANWHRPAGPPKVGLQVGHWKNGELPGELKKLRGNTGSFGGNKNEWEVNLQIARATAQILESEGIAIDLLPATVPPSYWADVFIAIHADGSTDPAKSGFKIASPWHDYTQKAKDLVSLLETAYQDQTQLVQDDSITRNMKGYYAFSWWKYQHAIHPMTTATIIETGFLTNSQDRKLLINHPEIPAQGIATGILNYLKQQGLKN